MGFLLTLISGMVESLLKNDIFVSGLQWQELNRYLIIYPVVTFLRRTNVRGGHMSTGTNVQGDDCPSGTNVQGGHLSRGTNVRGTFVRGTLVTPNIFQIASMIDSSIGDNLPTCHYQFYFTRISGQGQKLSVSEDDRMSHYFHVWKTLFQHLVLSINHTRDVPDD